MNPLKTLIINPSPEQRAKIKMIDLEKIFSDLIYKVCRKIPTVIDDYKVKIFISNVEHKGISAQKFAGHELPDFESAKKYFTDTGNKIYGVDWESKIIINELYGERSTKAVLGIDLTREALIKRLIEDYQGYYNIEFGAPVPSQTEPEVKKPIGISLESKKDESKKAHKKHEKQEKHGGRR